MVSKQVGVEVILLDSKCYPLLENNSTSAESFWRSTPKVLAANREIYDKLKGACTNLQNASVDLTAEDSDSSVVVRLQLRSGLGLMLYHLPLVRN